MNKEQLAQLVREKRTAKGITQQELADMAGISLRSVQRIENGEVLPRSYTLRVIAEKLGFDIAPTIEDSITPEEEEGADQTNAVPGNGSGSAGKVSSYPARHEQTAQTHPDIRHRLNHAHGHSSLHLPIGPLSRNRF
jgi:transcriptional regulator with XRE-family HTH domain